MNEKQRRELDRLREGWDFRKEEAEYAKRMAEFEEHMRRREDALKREMYRNMTMPQPQVVPARPGPFNWLGGEEPEPPPLTKSLVAGPVVGYRIWRLYRNADDLFLAAISRADVWPAGMPLHAGKPQPAGGVGAWALRGPEDLKPDAYNRDPIAGGRFVCFLTGRVALWGKVIEHEKGYRAEYAYPLTIRAWGQMTPMPGFPGHGLRDTIERVAAIYGVTVDQPR